MNILITGARAPVAMHLTRHLSAAGHKVWLADTPRFPISRATTLKAGYVRLPAPRHDLKAYGQALTALMAREDIGLIIPTCEEVFYLAALRDLWGLKLPLFAPDFDLLRHVHDKSSFANMSRGFGADAPESHRLETPDDVAQAVSRPGEWIYKPVWSRFGERVLIRPKVEAVQALRPSTRDPWLQQAYLPGEELCAYAVTHRGRVCALQAYRPLWRAGGQGIGAGVFVEPVDDKTISDFVTGFVAGHAWHGQVSFDFRRDADGVLHVIECNPRAVTGALFFTPADGLAGALTKGDVATPTQTAPLSIGLAMVLFGLPEALRQRRFNDWRSDMQRFQPMLGWPGDNHTGIMQVLALLETLTLALTGGQSLKAAATADIEWNGTDLC